MSMSFFKRARMSATSSAQCQAYYIPCVDLQYASSPLEYLLNVRPNRLADAKDFNADMVEAHRFDGSLSGRNGML